MPVNWPIGSGKEFQGVYDREKSQIAFFSGLSGKNRADKLEVDLQDGKVAEIIGQQRHRQLIEDVELLSAPGGNLTCRQCAAVR